MQKGDYFEDTSKFKLEHGRFLTAADLDRPEHTIVLNTDAFDKLYSSWEPNLYVDIKRYTIQSSWRIFNKSNDGWHDI